MTSFKDSTGRFWDIAITFGTLKLLRSRFGLNFDKVLTGDADNPLEMLAQDSLLLFEVINTVCEAQLQERHVSGEEFAAAVDGEVLEQAGEAFLDAFISFSRPAQREILTALRRQCKEAQDAAMQQVKEFISQSSPAVSEEWSASIPTDSRFGS